MYDNFQSLCPQAQNSSFTVHVNSSAFSESSALLAVNKDSLPQV